ncbi:MAG: heavy-metal-associated domain-containing protein [Gammaproteobacteria bacterium]|nr:heavy-metal-associated domain-containing protein [Gammaproteobacteria bacterium]MCZ6772261.1 heavy-metal-associated domain-containing protein [Pseudomonadota bacterium]MCZ6893489.1 heavy-metal-associated domain-containing protein [Gammaproteobacteria bacterium]
MLNRTQFFLLSVILIFLAAVALAAEPTTYHVHVKGLACPFCVYGLEKNFSKIEGLDSVSVNLKAGLIEVSLREGATLDEATVRETVENAGFTLEGFERATPVKVQDDGS